MSTPHSITWSATTSEAGLSQADCRWDPQASGDRTGAGEHNCLPVSAPPTALLPASLLSTVPDHRGDKTTATWGGQTHTNQALERMK